MSDLSPDTDQLLELARGAETLSDARRSQIKAALLTQIAAGGLVGVGSVGLGKAAWFSGPVGKLVSAVALVSVAGVGVYAGVRSKKSQPGPQVVAPTALHAPLAPAIRAASPATSEPVAAEPGAAEPGASEPAASTAVPTPVANGKAAGARTATASAASVASSAPVNADTLAEETSLLRAADQALRAGNAQRALTLLDEHAASYPHGALAPERSAERMIARCQLGQVDASSARAYLAAHPSSAFTARIRDACPVSR